MSIVQFVLVWIGLPGAAFLRGGESCISFFEAYSLALLLLWGWMFAALGLFCAAG